jgi:hypothetical protein
MKYQSLILWSVLFVLFYSLCASAQGPAGMVLLPGYKHETVATPRDSRQGRIWKESGLEIIYQYSGMAGGRISGYDLTPLWSKELTADKGTRIEIQLSTDRRLIVRFVRAPNAQERLRSGDFPAYFSAQVRNEEDIAEMLMMVMTFRPSP